MGSLTQYGPMGTGFSTQDLMRAMADPGAAGQVEELVEMYQIFRGTGRADAFDETKMANIIKGLGSDSMSDRRNAMTAMQKMLSDTSRQLSGDKTLLQPAILSAAKEIPPTGGQRRRFLNFVLSNFSDDPASVSVESLPELKKRFKEAENARKAETSKDTPKTGQTYRQPRNNPSDPEDFNPSSKSTGGVPVAGNVINVQLGGQTFIKILNQVVDGKIDSKIEELTPKP